MNKSRDSFFFILFLIFFPFPFILPPASYFFLKYKPLLVNHRTSFLIILILHRGTVFVFSANSFYISILKILTINNTVFGMTTKPPSMVAAFPSDSLEKIAYAVVADIPAEEANDRNRLGYCLWGWLSERRGTLLQSIRSAGVRSTLTPEEICERIRKPLEERGIKIS